MLEISHFCRRNCADIEQVQSATLGSHGFVLDRIFCVVDLEGTRHPKCEALSQRKLPPLGAVTTALSEDGATVTLSTPDGRKPLVLATDAAAYADEQAVEVECGGKDTITGAGWFLGKVRCRSAGEEACAWLSAYLNAAGGPPPSPPLSLSRSLAPSLPRSLAPSLPRSLARSLARSLPPSLPPSLCVCCVRVCVLCE